MIKLYDETDTFVGEMSFDEAEQKCGSAVMRGQFEGQAMFEFSNGMVGFEIPVVEFTEVEEWSHELYA